MASAHVAKEIPAAWLDSFIDSNQLSRVPTTADVSNGSPEYRSQNFLDTTYTVVDLESSIDGNTQPTLRNTADTNTIWLKLKPSESAESDYSLSEVLERFNVKSTTGLVHGIIESLQDTQVCEKLPVLVLDAHAAKNCGMLLTYHENRELVIKTKLRFSLKSEIDIKFSENVISQLCGFGISFPSAKDFSCPRTSISPFLRLENITRVTRQGSNDKIRQSSWSLTFYLPWAGFLVSIATNISGQIQLALLNNPKVPTDFSQKVATVFPDLKDRSHYNPRDDRNGVVSDCSFLGISFSRVSSVWTWYMRFLVMLKLDKIPVPVALTYDSASKTFAGILITKDVIKSGVFADLEEAGLIPDEIGSCDILDIKKWLPKHLEKLPPDVPTVIREASVTYSKASSAGSLSISAEIISEASTKTDRKDVPAPFDWKTVSFYLHKAGEDVNMAFSTSLELRPSIENHRGCLLAVDMAYSTGATSEWVLSAEASDFSMSVLADWFEDDHAPSMVDLLGHYTVKELDMIYTYKNKEAASFLIYGELQIGTVILEFYYQFVKDDAQPTELPQLEDRETRKPPILAQRTLNQTYWQFDASLSVITSTMTMGTLLDQLFKDDLKQLQELPQFVRNVEVISDKRDGRAIELQVRKFPATGIQKGIVGFVLNASLLDFGFAYMQIRGRPISNTIPATPPAPASSGSQALHDVTGCRIVRLSLNKLPTMKDVPVIHILPQPFDELHYLWVDTIDVTSAQADHLNQLLPAADVLRWKPVESGTDTIVLRKGHHLQIIKNGSVILDHMFFADPPPSHSNEDSPEIVHDRGSDVRDKGVGNISSPTKVAYTNKETPFLSISALSLKYTSGNFLVSIDGTVSIGPISMTLIGFEIVIPASAVSLNQLLELRDKIEVNIHGLGVSFQRPPVTMAGALVHERKPMAAGSESDTYTGGIGVGLKAWKLLAIGQYSRKTTITESYTSVFIFARLDGPLITLEFGTISGVRLGFGYNSKIRLPTAETLLQFPFIGDNIGTESLDNPAAVIQTITSDGDPWVTQKSGEFWLLLGMTITAFSILTVTAVAIVGFTEDNIDVSLIANAVGQMPPEVDRDLTLFYIELFILADVDIRNGSFNVYAVLSPASHVYVPQCKITGQAFLGVWAAPNENAGDFVLSIGGYHRDYNIPPHYNRNLQRIAMSCLVGNNVRLTGQAYFALTPKCAMVGGEIRLSLEVGPVHATGLLVFDVFVNFAPFHYAADMMLSINCTAHVDLGFIDFDIGAEVRCQLHLEGPDPFWGRAYVDFHLFAFHIEFGGNKPAVPDALSLSKMIDLVEAGSPVKDSERLIKPLKFTIVDGLEASSTSHQGQSGELGNTDILWRVTASSFCFRLSSTFPFDTFSVSKAVPLLGHENGSTKLAFCCKPMLTAGDDVHSQVTVEIQKICPEGPVQQEGFSVELCVERLPSSLWAKYEADNDPIVSKNLDGLTKSDGATVPCCNGLLIRRPRSSLSSSEIDDFDVSTTQAEVVQQVLPGLQTAPTVRSIDSFTHAPQNASADAAYTAFGQSWLDQLHSAQQDLMLQVNSINEAMGWNKNKDSQELNFAPPETYLREFSRRRLALPVVVENFDNVSPS